MLLRVAALMLMALDLANCAQGLAEEFHPYLLLSPRSSVESSYFGECKKLTNHSKKAVAYIPVGSAAVWHDFKSHRDQSGKVIIEVAACAQ